MPEKLSPGSLTPHPQQEARARRAEFPTGNFDYDEHNRWPLRHREVLSPYEMQWGWTARRLMTGDWDGDYPPVRIRYFHGSIRCDGIEVGAVALHEFDVAMGTTRREFYDCLDDHSLLMSEFGKMMGATFTEDEFEVVINLGSILFWHSAWMHPDHARGAIWARLTNQVIRRMRGYSILILKAFPLEYQGGTKGVEKSFRLRQNAMFRHYDRILGVKPIRRKRSRPYGTPERGWMLRWHPQIVEIVETEQPERPDLLGVTLGQRELALN